jgi:hypothetical protein
MIVLIRQKGWAFGAKIIAVIESYFCYSTCLVLCTESSTMVHCKEGEEMRYST